MAFASAASPGRIAHIYQARAEDVGRQIRIEVFTAPEAARAWLKGQGA